MTWKACAFEVASRLRIFFEKQTTGNQSSVMSCRDVFVSLPTGYVVYFSRQSTLDSCTQRLLASYHQLKRRKTVTTNQEETEHEREMEAKENPRTIITWSHDEAVWRQ